MNTSAEIRQSFIDFFKEKHHHVVSASPVAPMDDPTLLFINAGMNQFKDVFLGVGTRDYSRAVDSQPCIRVSGKHNDLEEVGLDTYHHTFFEMLGNWSFGDYYKSEAIEWAWELLTERYQLPKDKLYATVYTTDDESAELWRTLTDIDPDRILRFGDKDNFWEMGETGPCGPCSEIHIDRGPSACDRTEVDGHQCQVNGDCARYIELWNLVFIQYNRTKSGELEELPNKHVDTGAGLERLCSYLQDTPSNYDTDLFMPIINRIAELSGTAYSDGIEGMPHRVLADHIRTLTFAIADNVRPGNEGRGYVLRRLLRRGLRYAKQLGVDGPIMHRLVSTVVEMMGDFYPNIADRQSYIEQMIKAEEDAFLRTLDAGIQHFEAILNATDGRQISGADAFKLYDTFGFPLDLTEVMARERDMSVDLDGFNASMKQQQDRSRKGSSVGQVGGADDAYRSYDVSEDERVLSSDTTLHHSEYTDGIPRGGEARHLTDHTDQVWMARHHTATHLLQAALQQVLGDHVTQAGSLVDVERLRFDFTHFSALTVDQLEEVQKIVNEKIAENRPVTIHKLPIDEAKKMGAMALFGEKYDDIVRVVDMGEFSKELCGGTHVSNTGDIQSFKILSESGISAGTRRIEAIAGNELIQSIEQAQKRDIWNKIEAIRSENESRRSTLSNLGGDLPPASYPEVNSWEDAHTQTVAQLELVLAATVKEAKALDKTIAKHQKTQAKETGELSETDIDEISNGVRVACKRFEGVPIPVLRDLSDDILSTHSQIVIVFASEVDGKGVFLVRRSKDLTDYNAGDLIKQLSSVAGGGGGGRPDMAQAGGADPTKLDDAIQALKSSLAK